MCDAVKCGSLAAFFLFLCRSVTACKCRKGSSGNGSRTWKVRRVPCRELSSGRLAKWSVSECGFAVANFGFAVASCGVVIAAALFHQCGNRPLRGRPGEYEVLEAWTISALLDAATRLFILGFYSGSGSAGCGLVRDGLPPKSWPHSNRGRIGWSVLGRWSVLPLITGRKHLPTLDPTALVAALQRFTPSVRLFVG